MCLVEFLMNKMAILFNVCVWDFFFFLVFMEHMVCNNMKSSSIISIEGLNPKPLYVFYHYNSHVVGV